MEAAQAMKSIFLGAQEADFPKGSTKRDGETGPTRSRSRLPSVNLNKLPDKYLHALGRVSHAANDADADKLATGCY